MAIEKFIIQRFDGEKFITLSTCNTIEEGFDEIERRLLNGMDGVRLLKIEVEKAEESTSQ